MKYLMIAIVLLWPLMAAATDTAVPATDDPALEKRVMALTSELRCLVCQNQSIDDSNAPLARDLRLLVRERLTAGDTDGQVRTYVVGLLRSLLEAGRPLLLRMAESARASAIVDADERLADACVQAAGEAA